MYMIERINSFINGIVWGPVMLLAFLGIGLFFSIKLKFFQLCHFKTWWRETFGSLLCKSNKKSRQEGISSFQAVSTALAGSIGTGNIVGVASALMIGGAGSIFWMWAAAFLGMATVYAENVLGVLYRERKNGRWVGGPMYYISDGMGCKSLAVIFSILCMASAMGMGNMTQANSLSGALAGTFGIDVHVSGAIVAAATAFVVIGGINRIAALTEKLVPAMALIYIAASLTVILINIERVPEALISIFRGAFDIRSAAGGFSGCAAAAAIKAGVSRGVFSNEAGLGSSPIVHAAADTDSPERQGMWGMFQVFADTIVMCTLMALCILTVCPELRAADSVSLSTKAFEISLGAPGRIFISVSIVLFAFATLISWCYYGERALEYLGGEKYVFIYRLIYAAFAYIGSVMSISLVWDISDTLNGLMAVPNLIALIVLSGKIKRIPQKT